MPCRGRVHVWRCGARPTAGGCPGAAPTTPPACPPGGPAPSSNPSFPPRPPGGGLGWSSRRASCRVAPLPGAEPTGLWLRPFHSLDARLLRREAPLLGFGPNYTIYDEDDSQALIKRLLEARGHSPKVYPPRAVHSLISGAKNRMVTPEGFAADADSPLAQVSAEIYRALAAALQQANAMDFDDLLLHPLTLFAQHPERLAYWRRRFDHVLVDEFQDTNVAQYQLVKSLGQEHNNLCVVGDDDQAIYGWRGADVRHMLAFQDDFPGTTLVKLEQNYRSTQVVLDLAHAVIAQNA